MFLLQFLMIITVNLFCFIYFNPLILKPADSLTQTEAVSVVLAE